MKNITNFLAIIIVIVWVIGYFIYHLSGYFHWAMILALLVILILRIPARKR